ncbi:MAG: hypothetical protein IPM48_08500 [Saprospiraceae bacterium]|nr:hypothetical protein [Saprospiraceae bacterium]
MGVLAAQDVYFARTVYLDDFTEWSLHDSLNEPIGELRSRRLPNDRLDGWDLRIGDRTAFIRRSGFGTQVQWLATIGSESYTLSQTWAGVSDSWRITNNRSSYTLQMRVENEGLDWRLLDGANQTLLSMYNEFVHDLRDWVLEYDETKVHQDWVWVSLFLVVRNVQ